MAEVPTMSSNCSPGLAATPDLSVCHLGVAGEIPVPDRDSSMVPMFLPSEEYVTHCCISHNYF